MKMKFRLTLHEKRMLTPVLFLGGAAVALFGAEVSEPSGLRVLLGISMMLLSLVLPHIWITCPRCKKSLIVRRGSYRGKPAYTMVDVCPHCGMSINWWKRYP